MTGNPIDPVALALNIENVDVSFERYFPSVVLMTHNRSKLNLSYLNFKLLVSVRHWSEM